MITIEYTEKKNKEKENHPYQSELSMINILG